MKKWCLVAVCATAAIVLTGETSRSQSEPTKPAEPSSPVKVYTAGKDVTAPELLPADFSSVITNACVESASGKVVLSLIVDANGRPRNIRFEHPSGGDLDRLALVIAGADRFKPGEQNGTPVAVRQLVELKLDGCIAGIKDETGQTVKRLRLRSRPEQKFGPLKESPAEAILSTPKDLSNPDHIGGEVSAPIPLVFPEAQFSDEARNARYQGVCLISLIVDSQGMPRNPRIIRPLSYGLSEKAMEAVNKYRFKPAMKNGEPVPVMITVQVNFRLST
jgi:TonB family protein